MTDRTPTTETTDTDVYSKHYVRAIHSGHNRYVAARIAEQEVARAQDVAREEGTMTTAQAKGMLRLHEKMANAFREYDQPENLKMAELRAAHCRGVLAAAADKKGSKECAVSDLEAS